MDSFLSKGDTFRGRKEYVGKFALGQRESAKKKHLQNRTRVNTAHEHQRKSICVRVAPAGRHWGRPVTQPFLCASTSS